MSSELHAVITVTIRNDKGVGIRREDMARAMSLFTYEQLTRPGLTSGKFELPEALWNYGTERITGVVEWSTQYQEPSPVI